MAFIVHLDRVGDRFWDESGEFLASFKKLLPLILVLAMIHSTKSKKLIFSMKQLPLEKVIRAGGTFAYLKEH